MQRRAVLLNMGLLCAGLVVTSGWARTTPAKEATVTLEISGMT